MRVMTGWRVVRIAPWVGATLLPGFAAVAQQADSVVGRSLSGEYCMTCHVISPASGSGWTDAPSFVSIARRPGTTQAGLSAMIQKPHADMLNDQRPKPEADAIAAYIMSLRRR